jgi:hypothetical protein
MRKWENGKLLTEKHNGFCFSTNSAAVINTDNMNTTRNMHSDNYA